eukprot:gene10122-2541_t
MLSLFTTKANEASSVDSNYDIEAQQPKNTGFFGSFFNQSTPQTEPSFFAGMFSLTRGQRIAGFVISLVLGIFCLFLCAFLLPTILFASRKFAVLYTLGNFLLVGSTTFLVGPYAQLSSMFQKERIIPGVLYITTVILTIFCAFSLHNVIIMLMLIFIQLVALAWYIISYIPFGQQMISGFFSIFTMAFRN